MCRNSENREREPSASNAMDGVQQRYLTRMQAWLAVPGILFPPRWLLALLAFVTVIAPVASAQSGKQYDVPPEGKTEIFPFASYDTDAGFGLGLKLFALHHLQRQESFDIVLFWSTKGERWIRTAFSIRDPELRQGAVYPLAVDVVVDYDKWTNYQFFGVGNSSRYDALETYTKEPLELSLILSRGITTRLVASVGLRGRWIRNSGLDPSGELANHPSPQTQGVASGLGLVLGLRYDSRNSAVHPSDGLVLLVESELAPSWSVGNTASYRGLASCSWYQLIPATGIILATRASLRGVGGPELPVQMLAGVGGSRTVRGYVHERFIDRLAGVVNLELRFPILWRFTGIAGLDAGKVWQSFALIDLRRWATSPVVGLRFFMDTFIVRADVGFGPETTGFYLNFGHAF